MVPSRSRKTAGRNALVSDRTRLHRRNPLPSGRFDSVGRNARHAPVIRGAAAQKTWTAVWFFLNDAASRRYRGCAERIGWSEDGNDGETHCGGDVHGARVVPNKQMTSREKRGQVTYGRFPGEIDRRAAHARRNRRRNGRFGGRTEQNYFGTWLHLKPIREFCKSIRRPAFR